MRIASSSASSTSATASATALSLGALPISRSMMARAASSAMARTLAMAACLGGGDGLLGLRQLDVELALERLAGGVRRGRLLVARLVGDGLRAGAGIGQRLFIGRHRLVGLHLELPGLGDVVGDALLPALDDRGRRAAAPISPSARRAGRRRSRARRAARRRSATGTAESRRRARRPGRARCSSYVSARPSSAPAPQRCPS